MNKDYNFIGGTVIDVTKDDIFFITKIFNNELHILAQKGSRYSIISTPNVKSFKEIEERRQKQFIEKLTRSVLDIKPEHIVKLERIIELELKIKEFNEEIKVLEVK